MAVHAVPRFQRDAGKVLLPALKSWKPRWQAWKGRGNNPVCLSTVYNQKNEKLAGNVATVRAENGRVIFTDILGISTQ